MTLAILLASTLAQASEAVDAPPVDERVPVAVPEPTALAMRYYRTGNWLWAFDEVWALGVPALLLFTGASARMRDASRWVVRRTVLAIGPIAGRDLAENEGRLSWLLTIALYAALYTLIVFVIDLPLHYYQGFVRQHAYGLSNQTLGKWFGDSLKLVGVAAAVGAALTWIPYLLIARRPRSWWFITTVLTVPFLLAVVLLKPIWVDPLFNRFGPMKDKGLERKILAEARRAGIDGSRIFEVDKSVDTKALNAYVTGVGGTRRIVLWDTLLATLDERETLVVVGHEMGHYVLGHIPRSIVLSTAVTLAGLFFVDRASRRLIARFRGRFGFDRLSDVASVPLLLLLMNVSALVVLPITNAYSRFQENEADCFALELTRANHSAATAFVKLQKENLSNPRPGWLYKILRSTHPSIGDRIEFCNAYHPWREGRPLRFGRWFRDDRAEEGEPSR